MHYKIKIFSKTNYIRSDKHPQLYIQIDKQLWLS